MKKLLFLFVSLASILTSCEESTSSYLPGYSGNSGEIIIVINEHDFKKAKETIYQTIAKEQHGLPQAEQLFNIVNIPHKSFSKIFKVNRNIIVANIAPNNIKGVKIEKSVWAKQQLVVTITAGSVETFNKLLEEHAEELIFKFQSIEIQRLIKRNKKFGKQIILENQQMKLVLQDGAGVVIDSSDFVWIRIENERPVGAHQHQISQGVLIYYQPYTDTSQFSPTSILAFKDSITKVNVAGPLDGSYMSTSYKHTLPKSKEVMFKGNYAVRTTGLWRMENAHMGGPFVSLTTLDKKNGRLVTIEGYVFSPQFNKREFLREVEAIARSVEFL